MLCTSPRGCWWCRGATARACVTHERARSSARPLKRAFAATLALTHHLLPCRASSHRNTGSCPGGCGSSYSEGAPGKRTRCAYGACGGGAWQCQLAVRAHRHAHTHAHACMHTRCMSPHRVGGRARARTTEQPGGDKRPRQPGTAAAPPASHRHNVPWLPGAPWCRPTRAQRASCVGRRTPRAPTTPAPPARDTRAAAVCCKPAAASHTLVLPSVLGVRCRCVVVQLGVENGFERQICAVRRRRSLLW
jgi:hypothetical protein